MYRLKIKHPLLSLVVLAFFSICCSDEFSGNSPRFSGSSKSKGKSTDSINDPAGTDPSSDANPKDEGGVEGSDGGLSNDEDIKIEESETCITRQPGSKSLLDFEDALTGTGTGSLMNVTIADQFKKSYGVSFSMSGGHSTVVRKTARIGEPQLPAGEEAWLCILCPGNPTRNRLVDAVAEQAIGRFVLSSTAAATLESAVLKVDYRINVARLSFDLVDVDGSENWIVEAFDDNDAIIPGITQAVSVDGYSTDLTGNGAPTKVSIATKDGGRSIKFFTIRGDKPGSKFGFAFDNFEPGVPECKIGQL